jgi:hypothetical protein
MLGAPGQSAEWVSDAYRDSKYADHGRRLRVNSVNQYDQSARDTIQQGCRFTYILGNPPEVRVGYYDAWHSRMTVLDHEELTIINHMRASENYVRALPDSDHPF